MKVLHFRENREEYIKRAIFVLLTIFTAVLQNTDGLFPRIKNVSPMLLVPLVICISLFEKPITGMLFGLLAGFCWDFYSSVFDGFYIILLMLSGYACSMLINRYMRNNIVTALVFSIVLSLSVSSLYWLLFVFLSGTPGAGLLFARIYLPGAAYTVLLTPLYYFFIKMIREKYEKEEALPEPETPAE